MKQTIRIEVTRKLIRRGRRGNPNACPVALALKAAGLSSPMVIRSSFSTWETKRGPLTKKVTRWIDAFDDGKPVKPMSAVLRAERRP